MLIEMLPAQSSFVLLVSGYLRYVGMVYLWLMFSTGAFCASTHVKCLGTMCQFARHTETRLSQLYSHNGNESAIATGHKASRRILEAKKRSCPRS